jgi:hypothetical protein
LQTYRKYRAFGSLFQVAKPIKCPDIAMGKAFKSRYPSLSNALLLQWVKPLKAGIQSIKCPAIAMGKAFKSRYPSLSNTRLLQRVKPLKTGIPVYQMPSYRNR